MQLYTAQVCPFAHRVRLVMAAKDITHQRVEIDLADMPAWFKKIAPTDSVPLLETQHGMIWESLIIMEYLEEQFPENPLYPQSNYLRARGRIVPATVGPNFVGAFYKLIRGEADAQSVQLAQVLQKLEDSMVGDGPFWLGDAPTLTDLALYPWFERWSVVEHYRSIALNPPEKLAHWLKAMAKLPYVRQEACPDQLYIDGYSRYATPK